MACATKVNKNMSKKTREQDHQVNILNDKEKANILNEDKSKKKIQDCKDEIEKVLQKFGCSIYPVLQMVDTEYEQATLKKEIEKKSFASFGGAF